MDGISRRSLVLGMLAGGETLIDTHIHLFDPESFPYHPNAVYKPEPQPLAPYLTFAKGAGLTGSVIVHPEPYQDDHRYLEHCLNADKMFRGTCLFDPIAKDTPDKMARLVKRNKGRIVALRIHVNRTAAQKPTVSGAIRDRDLKHPQMKVTWRAAHDLGLAIQMHCIPLHAPEIAALAREFKETPVIIDHLARAGQGTPEEYRKVLAMAKLGNVYMKFSGVNYSSKQPPPHTDAKDLVRRTYDAFGPDRMIWGGLGMTMHDFRERSATFDALLGFAGMADRAKIRGLTAAKLFRY